MKTKRVVYFIILLMPCILYSCNKQLNLAPTDKLVESKVFSDATTAESALASVYDQTYQAATGDQWVIADVSLPYVGLPVGHPLTAFFGGLIDPTNSDVQNIWSGFYGTINAANVFVTKIPVYGKYALSLEKQHIAEAKFIRAYCYFKMLCYYGHGALTGNMSDMGLPVRLAPYDGFSQKDLIPRANNGTVYKQIIKDLTEAVPDLPSLYLNRGVTDWVKTCSRATKAAAWALLSRVYLYKQDYANVVLATDSVQAFSVYLIDPDLTNVFPANHTGTNSYFSKEVIWGFPASSNNGNSQFGIHGMFYYDKFYWADSAFVSSFNPNDKRRTQLIFGGNPLDTNPNTKDKKTTFKFNNPDQRDDIKVIRLAEVYLNKAEALAQLNGINNESLSLLNTIRQRAGLNPFNTGDFSSKEAFINEILAERYVELAFEGMGRFDYMRTGRNLRNPNLTADQKIFPIPKIEIDITNGVLQQNPGY
jgi:starch-binding outer membrane protein, SusD/RagB family